MQLRRSTEIFVHKQTDFFSSLLVNALRSLEGQGYQAAQTSGLKTR
jgi:hypothetical protein